MRVAWYNFENCIYFIYDYSRGLMCAVPGRGPAYSCNRRAE